MRTTKDHAWVLRMEGARTYSHIFDCLEKARKKNLSFSNRFIIKKVLLTELVNETNSPQVTKEDGS